MKSSASETGLKLFLNLVSSRPVKQSRFTESHWIFIFYALKKMLFARKKINTCFTNGRYPFPRDLHENNVWKAISLLLCLYVSL